MLLLNLITTQRKADSLFLALHKIQLQMNKDPNLRLDIPKNIKEKIGNSFAFKGTRKDFLNRTQEVKTL